MSGPALLQPTGGELPDAPEPRHNEAAIYVDGGILDGNPGIGGVAAVLVSSSGEIITECSRMIGKATNNEAEYKALLYGIGVARLAGVECPHFIMDSKLVVQQVSELWAIQGAELSRLHGYCTSRLMVFPEWSIQHVTREKNKRADWLVNRLLRGDDHQRTLKNPPTAGIEFRQGRPRPGWTNLGKPEYET